MAELTMPTSMEELNARFMANRKITGYGLDGVTQHIPCPFCASRDWYVVKITDFARTTGPIHCVECGRSARFQFSEQPGSSSMEIVQVAGPEQSDWMVPRLRHENPPPPRKRSAGHLDLEVERERPPNFHKTSSMTKNCHMCKHVNRVTGMCLLFHVKVERDDVCDKFEPRP